MTLKPKFLYFFLAPVCIHLINIVDRVFDHVSLFTFTARKLRVKLKDMYLDHYAPHLGLYFQLIFVSSLMFFTFFILLLIYVPLLHFIFSAKLP